MTVDLQTIAARFDRWGPSFTGSTRAVALMRIGLAVIAITRFGGEIGFHQAQNPGTLLLSALFFLMVAMMFVGYLSRFACIGTGLSVMCLYIAGALTQTAGWAHHHVYLLGTACLLLALTECGRSYSLDRWRVLNAARRARPTQPEPREYGLLWGQRLIALQLSAMYFWTAIDKTDRAFLSGERLEQTFVWVYSGRALEFVLAYPGMIALLSVIVVIVEYVLAVAILVPRWRIWALPMGLALHAGFYLMLPVHTYSATAMVLYLALLDPARVHSFIDRIQGHERVAHHL
ncbi:MAG: Vitamin K-dependent gamma-carboxylase [Saliniramus fredricksonii]|uniref:Vitamin K-dependent gamma-carboxylase n=1 Tax=Saliniramus fredricksonii TaxID=1653334 RepID=A0A0P7X8Y2_9HYPH|nr:HTTM domain-containing protein [Saliniramus fredricksonii]KPQ11681.1 MAG: Vitamin K-dependent gamma-carboxylase [Saliniramus fredricksonii]SCC80245.1 Vitamin K-dependent gamma-carboxylase [Saliniramus fredricksonii]